MGHNAQLERYKKLLAYLDDHLTEEINIEKVEEICHYSYRNINRIFEAIHQETIGKYIKRLRLEKAAQYLKYSDMGIAQIAFEVGYEERSAFSKAFKRRYSYSPQGFRDNTESYREEIQKSFLTTDSQERPKLQFEVELLPDFDYLFNEYRGDYKDFKAIDKKWESLFAYATNLGLVSDQSIFMTEIIDDAEISDHINSRYNQALILDKELDVEPSELFRVRSHKKQKYAKFTYEGPQKDSADFYHQIYAFWMMDVNLELVDLPILEFYPNFEEDLPESKLITEIYIAIA
ncbi:MAG: AraC family transcriptional regulator [Bacteroidota bacterium]